MKEIVSRFPFSARVLLALVLGLAAIVLSGIVYKLLPIKPWFPFVGEVLMLAATWLLLRTDRQHLSALGLNLSLKNTGYLFGGLFIGILALFTVTFLRTLYTGEAWHIASAMDLSTLSKSLYYILPTVMVQELMFRGYLFAKFVNRFGAVRANVIFSVLFMLVHVLDRDVLQNPVQLLFLAVTIPVGHLWFAAGLLRSKTLFFPIGLHWGNNWAVTHLTGNGDTQQTIFYLTGQQAYTTWPPFVILLLIFNGFFLLLTLATWKWRWPLASKLPG